MSRVSVRTVFNAPVQFWQKSTHLLLLSTHKLVKRRQIGHGSLFPVFMRSAKQRNLRRKGTPNFNMTIEVSSTKPRDGRLNPMGNISPSLMAVASDEYV